MERAWVSSVQRRAATELVGGTGCRNLASSTPVSCMSLYGAPTKEFAVVQEMTLELMERK